MVRFPPAWIPNVTLEDDKVERAVTFYRWTSADGLFRWVEKEDLVVVGTYLVHHQTVPYWDIILSGGVRGYSLYLHEFVELKWYEGRNLNPFDDMVQIRHYPEAHSHITACGLSIGFCKWLRGGWGMTSPYRS